MSVSTFSLPHACIQVRLHTVQSMVSVAGVFTVSDEYKFIINNVNNAHMIVLCK